MNSVSDWSTAKRAFQRADEPTDGLALALLQSQAALGAGDWVDALDPRLPAEPLLACPQLKEPPGAPFSRLHKLILLGVVFGVGAFALGYLAAAWLL